MKGSVSIVFNLFIENGIGQQEETWKKVNTWFAFRSAVAHHGAISKYPELSRRKFRERAELAYLEIEEAGQDRYLWSLREDVKLLLMRLLSGNLGVHLRVIT